MTYFNVFYNGYELCYRDITSVIIQHVYFIVVPYRSKRWKLYTCWI